MRALLIPSAILMPEEMRTRFGELPTGLFPIANKTLIENIYEKYCNLVDEVYIVGYEKIDKIRQLVNAKKLPFHVIALDKLGDLGYTIQYGLREITNVGKKVDFIYINFADCLFKNNLSSETGDYIIFSFESIQERWTFFEFEDEKIKKIYDKGWDDGKTPYRVNRKEKVM